MQIEVSYEQARVPVTIFRLEGELTVDSYEQLQQQAEDAVQAGTRNLVLDLADVGYISSSGLRAIHHTFNLLQEASSEDRKDVRKGISAGTFKSSHLKLLNPSPTVANVLKVAGFDMFLEAYGDLAEALASF